MFSRHTRKFTDFVEKHQRLSRIATQKLQLRLLSSFTILQWNYRWVLENGIFTIRFVNLLPLETVNKNIPYKKYCFPALEQVCTRPGFWRRILDSEDPQATTYPKQQTFPVKAPSLESLVNDHFFKAAPTSFVVDGFKIFHCFNYRTQGMFLILCYSDWEHRAFSHLWRHVRLVRHTIKWHPTSPVGKRFLLPHYHMIIIIWWS